MTEWIPFEQRTYFNNPIQPHDQKEYDVLLSDGTECRAIFDNYTDSYGVEPDYWIIRPTIMLGGKERTIHYVIKYLVTHWRPND